MSLRRGGLRLSCCRIIGRADALSKRVQSAGLTASALAALGALAGCTTAAATSDPASVDWTMAPAHFVTGEAFSPSVYDRKDASRCVGRWRLHADAIDDGAFSPEQQSAMTKLLNLPRAISAAEFFTIDTMVSALVREASDEAEILLRQALAGDGEAFRLYFEALGRCSTMPETVRDHGVGEVEGTAEE